MRNMTLFSRIKVSIFGGGRSSVEWLLSSQFSDISQKVVPVRVRLPPPAWPSTWLNHPCRDRHARFHSQFLENMFHMFLHRAGADAQNRGDFLVCFAFANPVRHFLLPPAQAGQ